MDVNSTIRQRFAIAHRAMRIDARDAGLPQEERGAYATSHACARIGKPLQRDEFWRAYRDVAVFRKYPALRRNTLERLRQLRCGARFDRTAVRVIDSATGDVRIAWLAC